MSKEFAHVLRTQGPAGRASRCRSGRPWPGPGNGRHRTMVCRTGAGLPHRSRFHPDQLEDTERDHYEFEAIDADGREIEIEIGFDGTVISFDVDDDRSAANADLMALLPQDLQDALAQYQFAEVTEYERGSRSHEIEGFGADGQRVEVRLSLDDLSVLQRD